MSRLLLVCSLFAALSSASASADRAVAPQFAQPPHTEMTPPDPGMVAPSITLHRASIRAALIQARAANLARFRAYQKTGVFPSNTFQARKLNVWRDDAGHFCAAATMIRLSGQTDLVDRVAEQSNFIRLADVRQGPLMDWILTSGFTQEEIAMIQEPFMPVVEHPRPIDAKIVDARLRTAEDARLRAKYRQVERELVESQDQSLDLAVDRLMKHPSLVWTVVAPTAIEG